MSSLPQAQDDTQDIDTRNVILRALSRDPQVSQGQIRWIADWLTSLRTARESQEAELKTLKTENESLMRDHPRDAASPPQATAGTDRGDS